MDGQYVSTASNGNIRKYALVILNLATANACALVVVLLFARWGYLSFLGAVLFWLSSSFVLCCWALHRWRLIGGVIALVFFTLVFYLSLPYKLFSYGVQLHLNSYLSKKPINHIFEGEFPAHDDIGKVIEKGLSELYSTKPVRLDSQNDQDRFEIVWSIGSGRGVHVLIKSEDVNMTSAIDKKSHIIIDKARAYVCPR